MLSLGPVKLVNPWLLAPMEAVSDVAFRRLCHALGASFTWTEMVRAASLLRENPATLALIDTHDAETPTGLQLLTKGPEELRQTLEKFFALREEEAYAHFKNVKIIDLNFGCPNPELIRNGQGPALVKRTAKMTAIFQALKETVQAHDSSIAVGAKIRLGLNDYEKEHKVALRLAEAANAHLDYLIVHGKHAAQRGSDQADWDSLKEFREALTIPFIANGGALDAARAQQLLAYTGADAALVARGAIQNPWIFRGLAGGAELPSAAEVEAASKAYKEDAERFRTRRKYREFHEENFARILAEAQEREKGKSTSIPSS